MISQAMINPMSITPLSALPAKPAADLAAMDCKSISGLNALGLDQVLAQLNELTDWQYVNGKICLRAKFSGYAQTLAFVNQVARIADEQDHHPGIEFGYGHAVVWLDTHDVNGISIKDFIVAAKISQNL